MIKFLLRTVEAGITAGIIATYGLMFDTNTYATEIDINRKQLAIKINTHGISANSFKIYTRLKNHKLYLYVRGAQVLDDYNDVCHLSYKFYLKNLNSEAASQMTWQINTKNELNIYFPIDDNDIGVTVKRIRIKTY